MKVVTLIALLGSLSLALIANAYLVFQPTSLALTSDLSGGLVKVRLAARPPRKVAVYFDAPKTRFDKCSLIFEPHNWDTPQTLRVVSEPFATLAVAERNVPVTFQAYSEDCNWTNNGKTVHLPTRRDAGCAGRCAVTGDPHFDTIDLPGTYHYQGEGDFYLVRSDILTVQARQRRCFGRPTCIVGLGIRYGSAVFIIDATRPINTMVQAVTHTQGVTISRSRCNNVATINIAFNSGSTIKVDIVQGCNLYSNVYINMGTYLRNKVAGLCGTFDGNGLNDFTGGNGHVYNAHQLIAESKADPANTRPTFRATGLNAFGESWRVPLSDNIFTGVRTPNRLPLDVAINQCLRPAANSVRCTWADPEPCLDTWQSSWAFVQQGTRLRRAAIPGATTNSTCGSSSAVVPDAIAVAAVPPGFQAQTQIPKFDGKEPEPPKSDAHPVAPPSQEQLDVFARQCAVQIGDIRGCTQDRHKFIDNCQVDVNQLMHPQAAWDLHRLAYTEACKEELLSLAQEPDEAVAAAARELAREQALGNSPCDANCKQCTDRGCTECKQSTYEVKNGRCELKSGDTPVANAGAFEPLPAARLLSRNEIAPQASAEQIQQVGDNPAVNPLAIVQQALGSGPVKLA